MKIHHIGYAVRDISKAKFQFEKLGYVFEKTIIDDDRKIYISFGKNDGYIIELVAPMAGEKTPVDQYLKKVGCTPYHICYETENLSKDREFLIDNGAREIVQPSEAIAMEGKKVCFLFSSDIGMIELVEK